MTLMPQICVSGVDSEIEEGGGIHIKWGLVQPALDAVCLQYVAQKPENEATHAQSCRGCGHGPRFIPCESASEAVGGHYNICGNWSVNSGDLSYCFSEPLPFKVSLCV